ncbi:UNVERIFIED_CONTAM: Cinnamoyl-CoA reductase-like SNL6 [Sesamum calycinum]|uniref:Cinnamoyl-CoA reductase-like SNL6 n=1 Tax=Sesamum calycinum TaxID=2727403 RepID=A0AAW2MMF0_9LAMI
MGILRLDQETQKAELEEFRRMLLSCAAVHRRKDDDGFRGQENAVPAETATCWTEDVEKLREMGNSGEMILNNSVVEVFMAKLTEVESLTEAFDGCRGVFHTAAFVDPAGLSGYSKAMADIEVNASKNVIKACGLSPSVRNCVLTSSLLTCIWRENPLDETSHVIDHKCWSDESVCLNKKLWYALGKLRAEKAAWDIAKQSGLKLATICPGLITGSKFYERNPTSTIAYLKGAQEMYTYGLLATVDIDKLAKAHVRIFEDMKKTASGRYICFDEVIEREDEVEELARETGINASSITGGASCSNRPRFELSNTKLTRLMLRTRRCPIE